MEASEIDSTPKKHARHISSGPGRAALPRRSTRGPLDITQAPVLSPTSPSNSQLLSPITPSRSPLLPVASSLGSEHSPSKDFSKLLRPEIFHPLTQLETPNAFRQSPAQPSAEVSLAALLETGHFRAAAILAAQHLTTIAAPSDHVTIFSLFYTRLASLTLCNATALAAQEVKALEDLNSSTYQDNITGSHLVPWELRVLAVRLQGMGFNDPRRGIMGYYDLAREARTEIFKIKQTAIQNPDSQREDSTEMALWESRLADLGIRVANALVEMEDLEGAAHHLSTLKDSVNKRLAMTRAILLLRLGNLSAARACVGLKPDSEAVILALGHMAEGKYVEAVAAWRQLTERDSGNEMYAQNLAVCLLYSGHMNEARVLLEGLVETGKSFHGLTFNLCTIYELCTDRSRALKVKLAEQVAALPDIGGTGWEKTNTDFKL